jgi:hypothetical protein
VLLPLLGLGGTAFVLLTPARPAGATDAMVSFDNLSAGTVLGTQYASEGVTFGEAPGGNAGGTPIVAQEAYARSKPNVATVQCGEVCRTDIWVAFAPEVSHVGVWIASTAAPTYTITIVAYDGSGKQVATTSGAADPESFATELTVSAAAIAYVDIQSGNVPYYAIDDLSYGPVGGGGPGPDFGLVAQFNSFGIGVVAGGSPVSASIELRRYNGSSGAIALSAGGLPAGVSVQLSPQSDTAGDGSTITATFSAAADAPQVSNAPVVITGTPSASAGTAPRSITIPLTVQTTYELRIQGMELTQGIQAMSLPERDWNDPTAPVHYSGAVLVADHPTVLRVFADAPHVSPGGLQGVSLQLTATAANGTTLGTISGGTYPNENGTGGLIDTGSASVPDTERDSASGGFDIVIPQHWTSGAAAITATLSPPAGSFGPPPPQVPCTDPSCTAAASMTLDQLHWIFTGGVGFDAVQLTVQGEAPPNVFGATSFDELLPTDDFVGNLAGSVDITWIINGCPYNNTGLKLCPDRTSQGGAALSTMEDFASNYDNGQGEGLIGVTSRDLGVEDGNVFGTGHEPVAVVDLNRPVTDVLHEIGHMYGLPHASADCGGGQDNDGDDQGQNGESWPPDQHGYIDGIGLDLLVPAPFPVISGPGGSSRTDCSANQSPPECGGASPQQFFDFMSYCTAADPNADGTLGSTNAWISLRNWDYIATFSACYLNGGNGSDCENQANAAKGLDAHVQLRAPGAAAPAAAITGATAPREVSEAVAPGMLRVYGFSGASGTVIALTDPTPTKAKLFGKLSAMTLRLTGAKGSGLASAPLLTRHIHVDGDGTMQLLEGAVPVSPSATGLQILEHGKVLTTRLRPAQRPTVTLLSPRKHAHLSVAGTLPVVWRTHGARNVTLLAAVDVSFDAGRSWHTAWSGLDTGRVTLSRDVLHGSGATMVRVRVDDGFDQALAVSPAFHLSPAGPLVVISSPRAVGDLSGGATLQLIGSAVDQSGRQVAGTALTWYAVTSAGPVELGNGNELVATLPVGTSGLVLTARDRAGRLGQASVGTSVTISPGPAPARRSGVDGSVTAGPACPVQQKGHPCPDKPLRVEVDALASSGKSVASTHSDRAGRYLLTLAPGRYTLVVAGVATLPRCPAVRVAVRPGRLSRADIHCDTGIR